MINTTTDNLEEMKELLKENLSICTIIKEIVSAVGEDESTKLAQIYLLERKRFLHPIPKYGMINELNESYDEVKAINKELNKLFNMLLTSDILN